MSKIKVYGRACWVKSLKEFTTGDISIDYTANSNEAQKFIPAVNAHRYIDLLNKRLEPLVFEVD